MKNKKTYKQIKTTFLAILLCVGTFCTYGTDVHSFADIEGVLLEKEDISNKVSIITNSSTNDQYPSAKAVYDALSRKQDKILAERGLSFGTGVNKNKLGHSNSITAETSGNMGSITFDSEGHINSFTETHLYLHTLKYQGKNAEWNTGASIEIYNNNPSPITYNDLKEFLKDNGHTDLNHLYSNVTGRANWVTRYVSLTSGGSLAENQALNYEAEGIFYNNSTDTIAILTLNINSSGSSWYAIYPQDSSTGWVLREDLEIINKIF